MGRTLSRKLHDISMAANLVRYVVHEAVHIWSHILLLVSLKVTQFQEVCDPLFRLCSDILHMQHVLAKVTALPENGGRYYSLYWTTGLEYWTHPRMRIMTLPRGGL